MIVIGLTGGTGSGKGVVSAYLEKKNAYIIDCDSIAHDIIMPGKEAYDEIIAFYGEEILDRDKKIIRKKLGDIVFSDKDKLAFLNECTHKYICREIFSRIQEAEKGGFFICVLDAPLLIEAGLVDICDRVWAVLSEEETQIKRIMDRDGITREQAKKRIQCQKSKEEYKRAADEIIDNNGDLCYVEEQIDVLLDKLKISIKEKI